MVCGYGKAYYWLVLFCFFICIFSHFLRLVTRLHCLHKVVCNDILVVYATRTQDINVDVIVRYI